MLNNFTNLRRNFVIGTVLFFLTIIGHFFVDSNIPASLMWPAFGFTAVFYYHFKEKALPGIIIGVFLGQMVFELFLELQIGSVEILTRVAFTFTTLLEAIIFASIFGKFKKMKSSEYLTTFFFLISAIIAVLVGSIFISSILHISLQGDIDFLYTSSRWFIGDLSGFMIFGSIVYFVLTRNNHIKDLKYHSVIYLFGFITINVILFLNAEGLFTFNNFGYILVLLYALGAVTYGYIILLIDSLIILVAYQILYLGQTVNNLDIDSISELAFSLNLFLISITGIGITIRYFYDRTLMQNEQIKIQNEDLQEMINSTHKFISLSGKLFGSSSNLNEKYLKEIFNISCVIFSNFDSASCFIVEDDRIKFIDALTYDINKLNELNLEVAKFTWSDSTEIVHNRNAETSIKERLKENYKGYNEAVPEINESIYLYFKLTDDIRGGISFDIFKNSTKTFSIADFEIYKSFHTLVYSIYENAVYTTQKDAFKSDLVWSLVKTLTYYDEYTVGHSQEVAEIALEIAKRLNLSEEQQFDTYWAGVVHDIGKIGIPADIINKPTRLTDKEYDIVKQHPVIAYDILKVNDNFAKIAEIVKAHHERVDGLGYPDKIKKDAIPFEALILTIADAVSSMGSKRPYSDPMSKKAVCLELIENSGKQFDETIVEIMIDMINDGWLDTFTTLCK